MDWLDIFMTGAVVLFLVWFYWETWWRRR